MDQHAYHNRPAGVSLCSHIQSGCSSCRYPIEITLRFAQNQQ
jgi:hypothetical protein